MIEVTNVANGTWQGIWTVRESSAFMFFTSQDASEDAPPRFPLTTRW